MNRRQFCGLAASTLAVAGGAPLLVPLPARAAPRKGYFFRDGDRVVMIGDSITEQHLHSNYVEIFTLSRFPAWKLAFRNAGIGGDTSTGGNARLERDVLSFKPTAVTITFGMNDGGYRWPYDPARLEAYRTGLRGMLDKLKQQGVRVAVLSSSPVEKKEDGPALQGYNQTLEAFAAAAREAAEAAGAAWVDQFHPHLEVLQKARDASAVNRVNGGDPVHPGPPGQLLMAWAILKGLNAPALVSSAEVNAARGRAARREGCAVTNVKKRPDGVSFIRVDEALPFWIPPQAQPILKWAPVVADLNEYTLKVTGLREGGYDLAIDGEKCGKVTAEELERGLNLALLIEGPIARQARAVYDAVFAKNKYFHDQVFRGVVLNRATPDEMKPALVEERMRGMEPLEQAVRDALTLKPRQFEVTATR